MSQPYRPERSANYYNSSSRRTPAIRQLPQQQPKKTPLAAVLLIPVAAFLFIQLKPDSARPATVTNTATKQASNKPAQATKAPPSTIDPAVPSVVVNKQHPLQPLNYWPSDLRAPNVPLRLAASDPEMQVRNVTAEAMERMYDDAKTAGVTLRLESGYRSYESQVDLYNYYVSQLGQEKTDEQSARPGYSEHQTGLAFDVGGTSDPNCDVETCFADTPEGTWIAANATKYGFIIRYPKGKEAVTGYEYEPWHLRYVGKDIVSQLAKKKLQTLEELYNVTGGKTYKS